MKNSFDILEEALNAKYHCFTCHTRSSSQIMFTQSCFSIEIYIWNDSVLFFFLFFFYCVEIQFDSVSKIGMYFTYSALKAAAGLVALSSLHNSNTFPFSPSPLPLKWPEFENHLLSGWDVLTVFFQFSVAGTFCSLMRAHHCPESAPHAAS